MPLITTSIYNAAAGALKGWIRRTASGHGALGIDASPDGQHMVGLDSGTVWVSHDKGLSYTSSTADAFGAGCVMSSDGQIIITASQNTTKILVSRDGGTSWSPNTTALFGAVCLTLGASDTGQYVALSIQSSSGRVSVSNDYGVTFQLKQTVPTSGIIWGTAVSGDGKYMYGTMSSTNIQRSADFGATWQAVPNTAAFNCNGYIAVSGDGRVVAACSGPDKIYVSRDYGATFSLSLAKTNGMGKGVFVSSDGTTIFATDNTNEGFISRDSGITWNGTGGTSAGVTPGLASTKGAWVSPNGSEVRVTNFNYYT